MSVLCYPDRDGGCVRAHGHDHMGSFSIRERSTGRRVDGSEEGAVHACACACVPLLLCFFRRTHCNQLVRISHMPSERQKGIARAPKLNYDLAAADVRFSVDFMAGGRIQLSPSPAGPLHYVFPRTTCGQRESVWAPSLCLSSFGAHRGWRWGHACMHVTTIAGNSRGKRQALVCTASRTIVSSLHKRRSDSGDAVSVP